MVVFYFFVSPKVQPAPSSAVAMLIFFIILNILFIFEEGCVIFVRKAFARCCYGTALPGLGSSSRARVRGLLSRIA